MLNLILGDPRPLYEQIKEKTKELILNGTLKEHEQLLSVRELAGDLAINPNTIRRAYKELEYEGYIYSQKAKGYFVMPQKELNPTSADKKIEILKKTLTELKYIGITMEKITDIVKSVFKEDDEG